MAETINERRRRKLEWLAGRRGGLRAIAARASLNWQSLDQVVTGRLLPPKADGSRSPRSLGDAAVQAIERAYPDLGAGWFDADDAGTLPVKEVTQLEQLLLDTFAAFDTDKDRLDALRQMNDLLTERKDGKVGAHNPFGGVKTPKAGGKYKLPAEINDGDAPAPAKQQQTRKTKT